MAAVRGGGWKGLLRKRPRRAAPVTELLLTEHGALAVRLQAREPLLMMDVHFACLPGPPLGERQAAPLKTCRSLGPEPCPLSPSHWLFSALAHQVLKGLPSPSAG